MYSKLQFISIGNTNDEQLVSIQSALDAGCDWIQMRYKTANEKSILSLAEKVSEICKTYKAKFIVNDYIEVAKKVDASGVHLGLNDQSIETARLILGPSKIIGGTANTFADVQKQIVSGSDYIGLGPYRFTTTKQNLSPILGLEGYDAILNELKELKITIPIYAIGGIANEDIIQLLQIGVHGIAVSSLITSSIHPKQKVDQLKNLLYVIS